MRDDGDAWRAIRVLGWAGCAGFALIVTVGLARVPFFDFTVNEGRYAEVAREMAASGDWVVPRLNGTPMLTKPPLLYWATAAVFRVAGPTEQARLVCAAAALVTVAATWMLGDALGGAPTGALAALVLVVMPGFALEARTLRPDSIVVAAAALAFAAWAAARRTASRAWLAAMWAALGIGIMAKGLVVPLLVLPVVAALGVRDGGTAALRRLRPGLGLLVLAVVVLPWHVAAAWRVPGFAWDYVVNQHLLFFLDRKLPRDSEGIGLLVFLAAFAGRTMPWLALALLPARRRGDARAADALPAAWLAWTLGIFALMPSRLEHYALPALPAVALLAARRLAAWIAAPATMPRAALAGVAATGAVLGVTVALAAPALLLRSPRLAAAAGSLAPLCRIAGTVLVVGGAAAAVLFVRRSVLGFAALAVASAVAAVLTVVAQGPLAPIASWQPAAATIAARLPADTEVVFDAPDEYQIVGGLAYYLGHAVTVLEPPGFTPPTFLAGRIGEAFVQPDELARRWRSGRPMVFVSDPYNPRPLPDPRAPIPHTELGVVGPVRLLTNAAALARE